MTNNPCAGDVSARLAADSPPCHSQLGSSSPASSAASSSQASSVSALYTPKTRFTFCMSPVNMMQHFVLLVRTCGLLCFGVQQLHPFPPHGISSSIRELLFVPRSDLGPIISMSEDRRVQVLRFFVRPAVALRLHRSLIRRSVETLRFAQNLRLRQRPELVLKLLRDAAPVQTVFAHQQA